MKGVAGSAHLSMTGMLWFMLAHTAFFVLLSGGYHGYLAQRGLALRRAASMNPDQPR